MPQPQTGKAGFPSLHGCAQHTRYIPAEILCSVGNYYVLQWQCTLALSVSSVSSFLCSLLCVGRQNENIHSSGAFVSPTLQAADIVVIETDTFGGLNLSVSFVPLAAECPSGFKPKDYIPNPAPILASSPVPSSSAPAVLNVTTQPHLPVKGTAHALALLEIQASPTARVFVSSISAVAESSAKAQADATAQVMQATSGHVGLAALRAQHEAWWAAFYPAGVRARARVFPSTKTTMIFTWADPWQERDGFFIVGLELRGCVHRLRFCDQNDSLHLTYRVS